MFGVPIVLFVAVFGIATPDSPSVSKWLDNARCVALSLRGDAAEAKKAAGLRLTPAQQKRIAADISEAGETTRELWEMDRIASPAQHAAIVQTAPLLRDLARNVEGMVEHLRSHDGDGPRATLRDYLAGHEEIAGRLAALIEEAIDQAGRTAPAHLPDERE